MVLESDIIRLHLVDDEVLFRELAAWRFASSEDFEIIASCGNGPELAPFAEDLQPRVILMDVLEDGSTFAVAEAILLASPTAKVVILDDRVRDQNVRETLRIEASGYLTKQQTFEHIADAIRQASAGRRVFVPEVAGRLIHSNDGLSYPPMDYLSPLATLTRRERAMLVRLAMGDSVREAAIALNISANTAANHKSRMMKKLKVRKSVELVHLALREGLIMVKNTRRR